MGSPHFRAWPEFFADRGHDTHALDLSGGPAGERPPGVTVHRLPRAARFGVPLGWVSGVASLRRLIRRLRPDVVHSHQVLPCGWLAEVADASPHVATAWGSEVMTAEGRALRRVGRVAGSADLLTADSRHLLATLEAAGADEAVLRWVPWGVRGGWAANAASLTREQAAARAGLPVDRPIVLSPRGPAPVYRQDVVIAAVRALRRERDVVVAFPLLDRSPGGGDGRTLRAAVEASGLGDAAVVVPPWTQDEFAYALRAAGVCASVPDRESAPNTVFEAFAVGTPAVVSRLPWVDEPVYREGAFGVVDRGDADALARELGAALDGTLDEHIEPNRRLVATKLDRGTVFGEVEHEYRRLSAGGQG